jgi:hypothetical protein
MAPRGKLSSLHRALFKNPVTSSGARPANSDADNRAGEREMVSIGSSFLRGWLFMGGKLSQKDG